MELQKRMEKNMELNAEQKESLITSLLRFVRRVSFQGADSPTEAETLPIIVALLLGKLWLFGGEEEAAESDDSQESENSGSWDFGEGCRCALSGCEKRCPSSPKKDILNF